VTVEQQLIENFEISSKACETTTLHAHIARRSGRREGKKKSSSYSRDVRFLRQNTRARAFFKNTDVNTL